MNSKSSYYNICFSEQPGRICAILIIAPSLFYCAMRMFKYKDEQLTAILLIIFASLFFVYELVCFCLFMPKTADIAFRRTDK